MCAGAAKRAPVAEPRGAACLCHQRGVCTSPASGYYHESENSPWHPSTLPARARQLWDVLPAAHTVPRGERSLAPCLIHPLHCLQCPRPAVPARRASSPAALWAQRAAQVYKISSLAGGGGRSPALGAAAGSRCSLSPRVMAALSSQPGTGMFQRGWGGWRCWMWPWAGEDGAASVPLCVCEWCSGENGFICKCTAVPCARGAKMRFQAPPGQEEGARTGPGEMDWEPHPDGTKPWRRAGCRESFPLQTTRRAPGTNALPSPPRGRSTQHLPPPNLPLHMPTGTPRSPPPPPC